MPSPVLDECAQNPLVFLSFLLIAKIPHRQRDRSHCLVFKHNLYTSAARAGFFAPVGASG